MQPTDVKIPVGQTAKFECKARYGKDVHIKYKFDNKLYDQQQSQSDKVYVNNKNELVIPNVQLSDSNKFIHCFVNDMTKFHSASDVSLIVLSKYKYVYHLYRIGTNYGKSYFLNFHQIH